MKTRTLSTIKTTLGTVAVLLVLGLAGTIDYADEVCQSMSQTEYESYLDSVGDRGLLTNYYIAESYEKDNKH